MRNNNNYNNNNGGMNMRNNNNYNNNNGGMNMRNNNKSNNGSTRVAYKPIKRHSGPKKVDLPNGTYRARVNTSDMYSELKAAINTRHQLDAEMKRRWTEIKNGYARREEMDSITRRIGNQTYKIDSIIHRLSKCKNQHSAIKLATDFLVGERNRTERIIKSNQQTIRDVRNGRCGLINSNGKRHRDTTQLSRYVNNKRQRLHEIDCLLRELRR